MFIHIKDHRIDTDQISSIATSGSKILIVTKESITFQLDFDSKKHLEVMLEFLDALLGVRHIEFVEPAIISPASTPSIKVTMSTVAKNTVEGGTPLYNTQRLY